MNFTCKRLNTQYTRGFVANTQYTVCIERNGSSHTTYIYVQTPTIVCRRTEMNHKVVVQKHNKQTTAGSIYAIHADRRRILKPSAYDAAQWTIAHINWSPSRREVSCKLNTTQCGRTKTHSTTQNISSLPFFESRRTCLFFLQIFCFFQIHYHP